MSVSCNYNFVTTVTLNFTIVTFFRNFVTIWHNYNFKYHSVDLYLTSVTLFLFTVTLSQCNFICYNVTFHLTIVTLSLITVTLSHFKSQLWLSKNCNIHYSVTLYLTVFDCFLELELCLKVTSQWLYFKIVTLFLVTITARNVTVTV